MELKNVRKRQCLMSILCQIYQGGSTSDIPEILASWISPAIPFRQYTLNEELSLVQDILPCDG